MKKIVLYSLLFLMLISVSLSFLHQEVQAEIISGASGQTEWSLNGTVLTISGNGAMANYTVGSLAPWGTEITGVILQNGVTAVGNNAFADCTQLRSVSLPRSLEKIGVSAFQNCTDLTAVSIPEKVNKINRNAFLGCTSLEEVSVKSLSSWLDINFASGANPLQSGKAELLLNGNSLQSVEIPEDVSAIPAYAFAGCDELETITIPDSVDSIGENAFLGCDRLNAVHIEDLEAWLSIGFSENANPLQSGKAELLLNGNSLQSVEIPYGVSAIPAYAFAGCDELETITIPDSVYSIGENAFLGCDRLNTVHIEDLGAWLSIGFSENANPLQSGRAKLLLNGEPIRTATVSASLRSIPAYAFAGCTDLVSVTIEQGSLSLVEESAFRGCLALEDIWYQGSEDQWSGIEIRGGNEYLTAAALHTQVCAAHSYQADCATRCQICSFPRTSPVGSHQYDHDCDLSCNRCQEARSAQMHLFDGPEDSECNRCSAGRMRGTTGDCTWILEGTVLRITGNGAMGSYLMSSAPWGSDITRVILEDGVTSVGAYAFQNCRYLSSAVLSDTVQTVGDSAFSGCVLLEEIEFSDNLSVIGENSFENCRSLSILELPEALRTIGGGAFAGCQSVTELLIPKSVTSIGIRAFAGCTRLAQISVDPQNTVFTGLQNCLLKGNVLILGCKNSVIPNAVTFIGESAFEDTDGLLFLQIPSSVTSIGDRAFAGCRSLSFVSIPDTLIFLGEYAFSECESLQEIFLPDGISAIERYTFYRCGQLSEIRLPSALRSIGECAFYGCSSLLDVALPETLESLEKNVFYGCQSLTFIALPEGLRFIPQNAFNLCSSLRDVSLPSTLENIDSSAFYGCDALEDLWYRGSAAQWEAVTVSESNAPLLAATLHPDVCADADHEYTSDCDTACNLCDCPRKAPAEHRYDAPCDAICNLCTEERIAAEHRYESEFHTICIECKGERTVSGSTGECSWSLNGTVLTVSGVGKTGDSLPFGSAIYESISTLVVENGVTEVLFVGSSFPNLKSASLSESLIWMEFPSMLGDCLESLTVDPANLKYRSEGLCLIDRSTETLLHGCRNSTSPDSVLIIGDGAFSGSAIKNFVIPDSVKIIGDGAFGGSAIKDIVIPDSVQIIGDSAFHHCRISELIIPRSVVSIGDYAFHRCDISTLYLSASVTQIGDSNFTPYAAPISTVWYGGTSSQRDEINFGENNSELMGATWHYESCIYSKNGVHVNENDDMLCDLCRIRFKPNISGTVLSHGKESAPITVSLFLGQQTVSEITLYGNSVSYLFEGLAAGDYTLRVEKPNHLTYEKTVTVLSDHVVQDVSLNLGNNGEKFRIKSVTLSLTQDINVLYYTVLPEGFENPRMAFRFGGVDTVVTDYTVDEQGRLLFVFADVKPQKMGDTISAVFYATVDGAEVSVSLEEYSVRQYCIYQLENNPDDSLLAMISDLLTFGAKTQIYQGYKTDELVTDGLQLNPSSFEYLDESHDKQKTEGTTDENVRFSSVALALTNDMAMQFGLASSDPSYYTFEVSVNGRKKTYTPEDLTYNAEKNRYYFSFDGIKATEYSDVVTACIKKDGQVVGKTLQYSVNSYVQKYQNTDDKALQELLHAIYNYGASADRYR
ncbi:MAG: leucine-rich repeat protein [Clostridia bacterium]|nr:leucine-rich repeat protein [Clostridia bacterium]